MLVVVSSLRAQVAARIDEEGRLAREEDVKDGQG